MPEIKKMTVAEFQTMMDSVPYLPIGCFYLEDGGKIIGVKWNSQTPTSSPCLNGATSIQQRYGRTRRFSAQSKSSARRVAIP